MTPWVRTAPELDALVRALEGEPAIALDTESDSLHHHREKVCLLQVAASGGRAWLVDPLALRDLSRLAGLMANADIAKVLHGADYDVITLKRDFRFTLEALFDTMIAARFLGLPHVGLQAVLLAELGVSVSKESQLDDWSRRPLTPTQEGYALDDVRHLLELHRRFVDKLRELGRLTWVEEECAAVAALDAAHRDDADAYLKIKGARKLTPRQLAVLRELVAWREAVAQSTDVPAFKILSSESLLTMAVAPPRNHEELQRVRGPWRRWPERVPALLEAVARAQALPESALPRFAPGPPRPMVSETTKKRTAALREWRTEAAQRLALDVSVVLPGRLLEKVAESAPREVGSLASIDGFRRWRQDTFGGEIVAVVSRFS